ncbi:MAG: preprotein translocase subunit SecE [Actinobacteria bacterium]|nr:MAG: preprotein translocase subunit SecE [Actinomycetota bacterium]TMM12962.1 MAG: preprotein translocase subunit SecE [Actinomycetota bacterium]
MARNRQRAKQRQAQRREARTDARRASSEPQQPKARDALGRELTEEPAPLRDALGRELDEAIEERELDEAIEEATGAPPQDTGRSDTVVESPPPAPIIDGRPDEDLLEEEDLGIDSEELAEADVDAARAEERVRGPRGRRGEAAPGQPVRGTGLGRVVAFLTACWAELQRVQWPDRKALTQLTGIVLFFVILAGAYLGALDAVFSKLIQQIL